MKSKEEQECYGGSTDDLANGCWWGTCVLMRGVRSRWVWSGDQEMRETFEGTRKIHHRKSWGWGRKQRQCPHDKVKKRRQMRSKNDLKKCFVAFILGLTAARCFLNLFFITLFCRKWLVNPIKRHWLYEDANKPERHCYSHLNGPQTKITQSWEAVCTPISSLGVSHPALISC